MKISSVEVTNLRYDYNEADRFTCAEGTTGSRVTSIVRVGTDTGLTGIGSAYSHPDLVRLVIEGHLAPLLIGCDANDVEGLWDRMYSLTRWYGRKGGAISALGAVDIALWDVRGQEAGQPIYQLLGARDGSVKAYASGLLWQDDLDLLAEEAARYLEQGFTLMKMRLGRDPDYDRRAVDAVLSVLDGGAELAVDGTHRYSLADAIDFGRFLSDTGIAWFEEPFPPEDLEAYAALRAQVDVPIAAGENEFGVQGFRELLRVGAVDIAQPDVSRTGGITEGIRIARLAAEQDVRIVTHSWSDVVALVANAHVVAASETGFAVEVDTTGTPLMEELTRGGSPVRSGRVELSLGAGLGLQLRDDILGELAVAPGDSVADGNYADLIFGAQPYEVVPPKARQ